MRISHRLDSIVLEVFPMVMILWFYDLCPALPSGTQEAQTKPLTFFSFLPKLSPGIPFSSTRQEMPLGPGPPVRHMTTYTSVSPPPLMKACRRAQPEKGSFGVVLQTNPEPTAAADRVQKWRGKDPQPKAFRDSAGESSAEHILPWENAQRRGHSRNGKDSETQALV